MKKIVFPALLFVMLLFSGCSVIEGIFKAGVWIGILASAVIVGVIIYIVMKVAGRR